MHFPHFHLNLAREAEGSPQYTTENGVVMSIVYVTADATFSGKIGGYTTLISSSAVSPARSIRSTPYTSGASGAGTSATSYYSGYPTAIATSSDSYYGSTTAYPTSAFYPSVSPSTNPTAVGSSSNSGSVSSSSGGLSTGAKAGITLACLLILALFLGGVLLSLRKLKKQRQQKPGDDDEKTAMAGAIPLSSTPGANHGNTTKPPRLSLRPVSRIMPEFISAPRNRQSHGNMLNIPESNPSRSLTPNHPPIRAVESPHPNNPFNDPQNPFADPEKGMALSAMSPNPGTGPAALGISATAGMAELAASHATQPTRRAPPTGPPAPEPQIIHADPLAAPGPVVAPGPGGQEQPAGNVYRVQMDFKPSMGDELELVTGQLVRLLHEYDDGWALCIRLDRSQQGVVPRTCLASKPSKPRPSHLNQYAKTGAGAAGQSRPAPTVDGRMSPAVTGNRPMSPPSGTTRTLTPQQSQSPVVSKFNSPRMPNAPTRSGMSTPQRSMSPAVGMPMPYPGMSTPQRSMSPAMARAGSPNSRPRSPPREMSPGVYNQAPRPLSPGPRVQPRRAMSPGPYGAGAQGPQPMGDHIQRRRSNSVGALAPIPVTVGPINNSTPALVTTAATPNRHPIELPGMAI